MVCQDSVWADQSSDCPGVKSLNELKNILEKEKSAKPSVASESPLYLQTAANELFHLNASISIAVHFLGIQNIVIGECSREEHLKDCKGGIA